MKIKHKVLPLATTLLSVLIFWLLFHQTRFKSSHDIIDIEIEANIPQSDSFKCYYEVKRPDKNRLFYEHECEKIWIEKINGWQTIKFSIPAQGVRSLRFDLGKAPLVTIFVRDVSMKSIIYYKETLFPYLTISSGIEVTSNCEYVEIKTTDQNPVWITTDIGSHIKSLNKKDNNAEKILYASGFLFLLTAIWCGSRFISALHSTF